MNGLIKTAIAAIAATACLYGGTPATEPTKIISPAVFGKFCETGYLYSISTLCLWLTLSLLGEGDWNAVNRGYAGDTPGGIQRLTGKTFENFTVGQVMDMQRSRVYAVGRYQFIPVTLRYAVAMSDVSLWICSPRRPRTSSSRRSWTTSALLLVLISVVTTTTKAGL